MLRFTLCIALIAASAPALAQIKPATSGALSFREPEMRRHRSGLHRPNMPHHRHRRYRHGYGVLR